MPQQTTPYQNDTDNWFVMCHFSPQQIETMLQKDSDGLFRGEGEEPLPPYRFFVPFHSIPLLPVEERRNTRQANKHYKATNDRNALRDDLHDFVFIQASAERVSAIVHSDWNVKARLRLYYYRDTNQRMVTVSDVEMRQLMATIYNRHLQFYIDQPIDDFIAGDKVILKMEPWVGKRGVIKKIAIKRGQLCMTISMNILGRTKSINFTDVHVGDVLFEDAERGRLLTNNPIDNYEEEIIDLLSHRFGHHYTDDVAESDRQRLRRLSSYDHLYVDDSDDRARFASLRLICAYLLQNLRKKDAYQHEVTTLLGSRETPESDAEAYLMTALFITTRQAHWRDAVKAYRNTHPNHLPILRRYHAILKDIKARNSECRAKLV